MSPRVALAAAVGVLAGVAISACIGVDREGAPCARDNNCPTPQYCNGDPQHVCKELSPPPPFSVACPLIVETLTQRLGECAGGTPSNWASELGVPTLCATLSASVDAGRQTYDGTDLRRCREAMLAAPCSTLGKRLPGQDFDDCMALTGTVAPGSSCSTTKDCVGGWCDTTSGCLGTCKAYVAVGGTCNATDLCAPGNGCSGGTCLPYVTSGACDAGLCNSYMNTCDGAGQCVLKGGLGASCSLTLLTIGAGSCQPPLNCTGTATKSCQAGKAQDATCTPYSNECELFETCATRNGGNFCSPYPGPGDACGLQGAPAQEVMPVCRQSRCQIGLPTTCLSFIPSGNGTCNTDRECGPLARCISGTCRTEFCP